MADRSEQQDGSAERASRDSGALLRNDPFERLDYLGGLPEVDTDAALGKTERAPRGRTARDPDSRR